MARYVCAPVSALDPARWPMPPGQLPDRVGLARRSSGWRWLADPEQVGEPERVASAGLGFTEKPVGAQVLRGDAWPAHGGLDVAAADGLEAAGGAAVDQQVRVGGGGPAGAPGLQPCAQVPGGELVERPGPAADQQRAGGGTDVVEGQGAMSPGRSACTPASSTMSRSAGSCRRPSRRARSVSSSGRTGGGGTGGRSAARRGR